MDNASDTPLPQTHAPSAALSAGSWRRALTTSALGLTLGAGLATEVAQAADTAIPAVSVDATAATPESYQVTDSGLAKLGKLRDTPQSVSTVSQQLMADQNVQTIHDALRNVPGISLAAGEYGNQGDNLTIRGFSARGDIYLDGMRDFGSYYRDPFDTESVEVLKGPSSMLFGRGSTGGVVENNTKRPSLTNATKGEVSVGSDATKRITMDVNQVIPQLQGTAVRLNVMGTDAGYTGRDYLENRRLGIAPSIVMGLGTPTRFSVDYLHQTEYDRPDYGLPWNYSAPAGAGRTIARPLAVDPDNYYGFKNGNYLRANVDIVTGKVEHDVNDNVTIRDQARYGHYTREFRITEPQIDVVPTAAGATATALRLTPGTPLGSLAITRNELSGSSLETFLQNQFDTLIHVDTGPVRHTIVAGLEVGRETSDPVRYTTIGPYSTTPALTPDPDNNTGYNSYLGSRTKTTALSQAGYVYDTADITRQIQLIGGVRLDRFDAHYTQLSFANPVTGAGAANVDLARIDSRASWRLGAVYKPLPNGSIYVDWGTSFNPSAENLSLTAPTGNLAPETNQTYELGTKWDLLHQRLSLTGAVYHTQKNNARETDPTNSNNVITVGNVIAKGFEFQATGNITDKWQVNAGYAYTFTKVVSSPFNDIGDRLANAPMHTANLWTTYRFDNKVQLGSGVNYVSSRFASSTPKTVGGVNFFQEAPGNYVVNAMAHYPLNDRIGIQVNVINLTDKHYIDLVHPSHVIPGEGRTVMFSTSFKL